MDSCKGCIALHRLLLKEREEYKMGIQKFSDYIEALLKRNAELERQQGDPPEAGGGNWTERELEDDIGGEKTAPPEDVSPSYKLPLVPAEKEGAHVILCPPIIAFPAVDLLSHKLAVGVIKKYEKLFIDAADRYERWARNNIPLEVKSFDGGAEWIFIHLALFKAANPIPKANFATIYSPSAVLRWHNAYNKFKLDDDRFLVELQKKKIKPITSNEDLKKFIKKNT